MPEGPTFEAVEGCRAKGPDTCASLRHSKMLESPGGIGGHVTFAEDGLVLGLRRRRPIRPVCPCGKHGNGVYDRSVHRWRHLDWGAAKVSLQEQVRRLDCRGCGRVRTEQVPWARPKARHRRDLQDVVAWPAQHTDKPAAAQQLGDRRCHRGAGGG